MNRKHYKEPQLVVIDIDPVSIACAISSKNENTRPGNSGNAPGHNKDENGKPIKKNGTIFNDPLFHF